MTMTDRQKFDALKLILDVLLDAVRAGGDHGAPGGVVYAALMTHAPNCTAAQFEQLMSILVDAGKVTKHGQLYFAVNREKERA